MNLWLTEALERVRRDPASIHVLFPAAGRMAGRDPLHDDDPAGLRGTADDEARTRLLAEFARAAPDELPGVLRELYRFGDRAERRGVLRALPLLPGNCVEAGQELVEDALRTNDLNLVAAALGLFAARHLDRNLWRHGVLKCLGTGIPLAAVASVESLVDAELLRMVADHAAELQAAGRAIGADVLTLLAREG
jgi:L-ribulose-5-phosphate 3-epimerase